MKKGSTFLVFILVVFFSMGGVFVARSMQGENEVNRDAQATEAPREVAGSAVAQMPTKSPATASAANSNQENAQAPGQSSTVNSTPTPARETAQTATAVPTQEPTKAPAVTAPPTATPTQEPSVDEETEIAGVSREEIAAVAELMGVSEEEVELVLEKAAENGYTFDVEAIKSGEVDIQELWGVVTDALGEERAYELLIKALGSNLF